ncbi:ABC transporter permease [Eubacteriaceae bacterium ES3]|nr:ABC transporter permease [Eubacteriaceae bacterium ES3]
MKLQTNIIKPLLSIVFALIFGALIIALIQQNPVEVYQVMWQGAFGSKMAIAATLVKATTLIFVGLAYGFAYKCGLVNIGIEGQLYMGALFSTYVAVYMDLPMVLHVPLALLAGFIGGAFWGGIVGFLKNRFNASEMITTVMMNYVAVYIVSALVNGPMMEEKATYPQSDIIMDSAKLIKLIPNSQLTIGLFIALAALVVYYIYWKYTPQGFRMATVGTNKDAAEYVGIPVKRMVLMAMVISGGIGGLAGSMEVLGVQHKLLEGLSAGYGFDGIAVALLGNSSAIGIFFSSILFGALRSGGNAVQMFTRLPIAVIYIIQGLVIIFVVVDQFKPFSFKKPEGLRKLLERKEVSQ